MNKRDQKFFDEHWEEWIIDNSPPVEWGGSMRQWAEEEMPCQGFLVRFIYWFNHYDYG